VFEQAPPFPEELVLLCFFVHFASFAVLAKFCELKTCLKLLLVLRRMIIDATAFRAFKFDEVIL
jgi:hypothetical protein